MVVDFEIRRRRRQVRSSKGRLGILGRANGTDANELYHPDANRYWAQWIGPKDSNGDNTFGVPFPVYAGDTNYMPEAGRLVRIGMRDGHLTVLRAVLSDLEKAGHDLRYLNPNDPYRQYQYTGNLVTFRSDPVQDIGETDLKANLNQLLYLDAYGNYYIWNGSNEDTHPDITALRPIAADQHCLAIVSLKTLENEPQTVGSTPKSIDDALVIDDLQECKSQLDPECMDSRVYRLYYGQETLIIDPVYDWDLRQWINVPARLGNPNPVIKQERVRSGQQIVYHGFFEVTGWLENLGELLILPDTPGTGGSGASDPTTFTVDGDTGDTMSVTDGTPVIATGTGGITVDIDDATKTITIDGSTVPGTLSISEAEIDLGSTAVYDKKLTVTDAGVSAASKVMVVGSGVAATGKSQDENEMDALVCRAVPDDGEFLLYVSALPGPVTGKFNIYYMVQ